MKQTYILFLTVIIVLSCSADRRFSSRHSKTPVFSKKIHLGSVYQKGQASYYAHKFHGRQTANGEKFDMHALTAAHKKLPFNTKVKVLNLDNGKSVIVRINDRGPYAKGRIIDLSLEAGKRIGLLGPGHGNVELIIVE